MAQVMKQKNVSQLNSHLGYQLRVVSNAVSQSFAAKLLATEVTVAEWVILREMYSEEVNLSPSHVAEMTGLTRGAVSKLIDRLILKGLIFRTESLEDRRYQEIKLSTVARKLVPKLAQIADKNDLQFFSILSETDKKNLKRILNKIAEHQYLHTKAIN